MILCDYGCGQEAKYEYEGTGKFCCCENFQSCPALRKKNSIAVSKSLKGKKRKPHSEKWKISIGKAVTGKNNAFFGRHHTEETKEKIRKKRIGIPIHSNEHKEQCREDMLNGKAVYMNHCIKIPTKPQLALFRMLEDLCSCPILEYPVYWSKKWNYCIDIADPRLGLAFEYDGEYWHRNKFRDLRRQKRLESLGWSFLRYSTLPTLDQLRADINQKLTEVKFF